MGKGFAFDIEVRRGAGAYIAGEETALINSLEGKRAEPRNKPPFPAQSGLFGKPTAVNNVETLLSVLEILRVGGPSFASVGTENSTGTRLFCLSGCVARPGLYEYDFGVTLREVIDAAGGVRDGRPLQAVLLGGAAGSFVGPSALDMPLTFEAVRAAGTTLGSGVVLVLDDTVDVRRAAAPDHPVLQGRVLRAVRAVPGRHGAPGGTAGPAGVRHAARERGDRAGACSTTSDRSRATLRSAGSARPRFPPSSPPSNWA